MITFAFLFYLLALTSCIGAGYVMWVFVFQKLVQSQCFLTRPSFMELGVVGLLTLSMLAALVNFFAPVSQYLSALIVGSFWLAGMASLINSSKPGILKSIVFVSVLMLFTFWGVKFFLSYDSGLYHLQAISWMKDEPIVFGLANLHDRLGFNSLMFTAFAIFWLPIFELEGLLLANYLPAILTVLIFLNHLLVKTPNHRSSDNTISSLFVLFSIVCLAAMPTLLFANTTSTDLTPNIYTLLSAFLFFRAIEQREPLTDEVFKTHVLLWVVALFAVLTKLSAVTPCLLALFYSLKNVNILGSLVIRYTVYFLATVTGIWVLRNFVLSGCLIFPLGFTCADTNIIPWSIGSESANLTRSTIEWWARTVRTEIPLDSINQQWLTEWIQIPSRGGLLAQITFSMAGLPLVTLLFLYLRSLKQSRKQSEPITTPSIQSSGVLWVALSAVIGLLFGFLNAPDPRFWWGALVTLFILLPLVTLILLNQSRSFSINFVMVVPVLLCSFIFAGGFVLFRDPMHASELISSNSEGFKLPRAQTRAIQAKSIIIHMPNHDDRCWLAPRPCTPTEPVGLNSTHIAHYLMFSRLKNQ